MSLFDWGPFLAGGPLFIGILNLTPDSFSDGGRFAEPDSALAQARALLQSGAGMLDVGAESTRPGAAPLDPAAEWQRLEPVLVRLRRELPHLPISVDTRHAEVAGPALAAGATVLNDVTGFSDPAMLRLAQVSPSGLIAMRSRQEHGRLHMPPYEGPGHGRPHEAVAELTQVRDRLLGAGISPGRILLDPGFGFGTTFAEDQTLWQALPSLPEALAWPAARFCLGLSRKRFLAWKAGQPDLPPAQRDALTAAAHVDAETWGYRVFRTHAIG